MPNTILTPTIVAKRALLLLKNNCVTASLVYRDYEQEWKGAKVGDEVKIRQPAVFDAKEFTTTIDVQDITEGEVPLKLEKHFDVSVGVTAKEWTLELDQFATRVIQPAMVAIAQKIDEYILSKYVEIPYWFGDPNNADPRLLADMAGCRRVLNENAAPLPDRNGIIDPVAEANYLTLDAVVNAEKSGSTDALRNAVMGRLMGANWFMDQNTPSHTMGDFTKLTGITVAAAAEGATSVDLSSGTGTESVKKGDLFSISGHTQTYVITGDATAVAGTVTCSIYPGLEAATSGGENVTMVHHDSNLVYTNNLYFHRDGIALAVVPLELPRGNNNAQIVNYEGFGIRVVYGYDVSTKKDTISFDILVGSKVIQPKLTCRLVGSGTAPS